MDQHDAEWSPRELSEPLRQGDIFVWGNGDSTDAWLRHGILVTADCDLAQNKHRDVLSYCPVMSLDDFLRDMWIPDDLARAFEKHAKNVADRLTSARRRYRPVYDAPIDPELLLSWLMRRTPPGVADDAGLPIGKDRDAILKDLRVLQAILDARASGKSPLMLQAIAKARLMDDAPTPDNLKKKLNEVAQVYHDRVRNIPGDLFFLNELSAEYRDGYVVALRRLREIPPTAIAIRPADLRRAPARRISRLRAPFRYRLTQKLAAMFADIGLPHEYEEKCLTTVSGLTASMVTLS